MIIFLMSFIGDLVCAHVIHDVRTYGEVEKKKGQEIGDQYVRTVPDRRWQT